MIKMYKKIGYGTLNLRPWQVTHYMREIETDNGLETTLLIARKEEEISMNILHYNAERVELMRSDTWTITPYAHLAAFVKLKAENHWIIEGKDSIELHIEVATSGDILLYIMNTMLRQVPSQVPTFSIVTSGTKSKDLLSSLVILKRHLSDNHEAITQGKAIAFYAFIADIYDAIKRHHLFQPL